MGSVNWDALGGGLLDDVLASESGDPDFGDRYEVREVLGRGGQGTVYRAWDRVIEREVAIKTLRDPGLPQRPLLEEARLLSRLAHPAIPQIYDRGVSPDGGAYAVIQFIQGRRLDQVLRLGEGSLMGRLRLFRGVAGAVAHAHLRGILHRDLKPENVMVSEAGEPYLVDWGLAANGGPRAVCGSPYFAAPEQLDNQPVDARVDVYALGVLLFFVLTGGRLPYSRSVTGFEEFQRQRAAIGRYRRSPCGPGRRGRRHRGWRGGGPCRGGGRRRPRRQPGARSAGRSGVVVATPPAAAEQCGRRYRLPAAHHRRGASENR